MTLASDAALWAAGTDADPRRAAGLALWLDAADPATLFADAALTTAAALGDRVGGWRDKSGAARHATQGGALLRPQLGTQGLEFDGVDDQLAVASLPCTGDLTVFVVGWARSAAAGATRSAYGNRAQGAVGQRTFQVRADGTGPTLVTTFTGADGSSFFPSVVSSALGLNVVRLMAIQRRSSPNDAIGWRSSSSSGNPTATAVAQATGPFPVWVGGESPANCAWDGGVCELLHYARALSASERAPIEAYLRRKWGAS